MSAAYFSIELTNESFSFAVCDRGIRVQHVLSLKEDASKDMPTTYLNWQGISGTVTFAWLIFSNFSGTLQTNNCEILQVMHWRHSNTDMVLTHKGKFEHLHVL